MILILGNTGMLGRYLYEYASTQFECVKSSSRADGFDVVKLYYSGALVEIITIILEKVTHVVNCIGDISKNGCAEQFIINSYFPHLLSEMCNQRGIVLYHPSTDCVFSGLKMYDACIKDPVDNYGASKYLSESINASVIRTSIIGEETFGSSSLVSWVKANKGKTVKGYTNHNWNGVTCLELTKWICKCIKDGLSWKGVVQLTSRDNDDSTSSEKGITKHELVKLISDVFQLNVTVEPCETKYICDRRLLSTPDTPMRITSKTIAQQLEDLKNWSAYDYKHF